jgi:hypothetical protein
MWGVRFGSWWMFQWSFDRTFSLGLHLDPMVRPWAGGLTYGPYLDLHLGVCAISLGRHPARANNHSLMRPEIHAHTD